MAKILIPGTDGLVGRHLAIWLNAVLQTEELPAPGRSKRSLRCPSWEENRLKETWFSLFSSVYNGVIIIVYHCLSASSHIFPIFQYDIVIYSAERIRWITYSSWNPGRSVFGWESFQSSVYIAMASWVNFFLIYPVYQREIPEKWRLKWGTHPTKWGGKFQPATSGDQRVSRLIVILVRKWCW
jgi:hypothetical protein